MKYRIFFVAFIVCAFLFSLNGCFLFGGGKEEAKIEEELQEKPPVAAEEAVKPPEEQEPPVEVSPVDFQEGENDVTQVVSFEDTQGDVIEGKINWSKGFITALGKGLSNPGDTSVTGRLSAREAAYTVALAYLLETTKGVHVTAETTVEMNMLKSQEIKRKVEGTIKGAMLLDEKYEEESGQVIATVLVGIALGDIAADMPLPRIQETDLKFKAPDEKKRTSAASLALETLQRIDKENKVVSLETLSQPDGLEKMEDMLAKADQQDETIRSLRLELKAIKELLAGLSQGEPTKPYTGIVFNAVDAGMAQVLFPRVYYPGDTGHKLLYGDPSSDRPSGHVAFWSGWAQTLTDAKTDPKVNDNPFVIDGISVNEDGEPVIRPEDAERINELEDEYKFLADGKIVFIL
jgi:hypothetical protein